jgi:hypothetical protein
MRRNIAALAVSVLAATQTAASAQTITVQSLMNSDYTVVGITTSSAGAASIYLQKGKALVYCFAAETPTSPTVATKYCKPVQ